METTTISLKMSDAGLLICEPTITALDVFTFIMTFVILFFVFIFD